MRPANLIPPEERRDRGSGLRAAPVAYIVVGALLLALGGLTLLMTTNNQISDHKGEITAAEQQTASAEARVAELASYTKFHSAAAARTQTVTNLANSRFDWEKVMRQMALISPSDIWLTSLSGSVRSGVSVGGAESVSLRSEVPGPALSISGCALSQTAVANYVTELKEIEGVTRVGLQTSDLAGTESGSGSSSSGCAGLGTVTFQAVAAFDAAPIPTDIIGGEALAEAPVEESTTEGESESSESTEGE
jgi:Tfp pilus assembly protein PilN